MPEKAIRLEAKQRLQGKAQGSVQPVGPLQVNAETFNHSERSNG